MSGSVGRKGQSMHPQERESIPIAALKNDFPVLHVKKAAAAQTLGIPPLQNDPFAVFKDVFRNAMHRRGGQLAREHLANRLPAFDGFQSDLMIDRLIGVEFGNALNIAGVEPHYPKLKHFAR